MGQTRATPRGQPHETRWVSLCDDHGMAEWRTGDQLASVADPAWPALRAAIAASDVDVVVLPPADKAGHAQLEALQISAASAMGAIASRCGGLIADHGWFRLLGAGGDRLPSLAAANGLPAEAGSSPGSLLVGWDALGGRFAVGDGSLEADPGEVCYFGPDTLAWGGLGCGYSSFVQTLLAGGWADAFSGLRWPGWERDVSGLAPDQGLSLYPPPFSVEGRDMTSVSHSRVPITELIEFYDDVADQLRR